MDIRVRFATVDEIPLIVSFIHEKAEFDGCPTEVKATAETLKQALFGESPLASVLFAEVDGQTIGFATFFPTFSTFLARPGIWLDDLYVQPHVRGQGVGTALLNALTAIARERNCGRIEWTVATNNANGIQFYEKQDAQIMQTVRICRLNHQAIQRSAFVEA